MVFTSVLFYDTIAHKLVNTIHQKYAQIYIELKSCCVATKRGEEFYEKTDRIFFVITFDGFCIFWVFSIKG